MPNTTQRAIQSDPGRFRAVLTFDIQGPENNPSREAAMLRAATLLKEVESDELKDKPLKILVALAARVMEQHEQWRGLASEYTSYGEFHEAAPAVLVQVAAETEDERTYALRLVKRVFAGVLELREEYYGGRHLLSRESFGYRDAFVTTKPEVPQSSAAPGASWLLYQRCVQNIDGFYQAPNQDDIIGRERDAPPDTPPRPGSHIDLARRTSTEAGKALLLRRSFTYETFNESGMVFLACAARAAHLVNALNALNGDPLSRYIERKTGGIYVVPPSSRWLAPQARLEALEGERRPAPEQPFYPKHSVLLYEVTPATLQFFLRVFHANRDNFDENGTLRDDLKVLAKGLAKLLYGAKVPRNGQAFRLFETLFAWDLSEPLLTDEIRRLIEDLRRHTQDGVPERELAKLRERLRQELTRQARGRLPRDLAKMSALDVFLELAVSDAEYLAGSSAERREDFETLIDLCVAAADQARDLNAAAGHYMTFMC